MSKDMNRRKRKATLLPPLRIIRTRQQTKRTWINGQVSVYDFQFPSTCHVQILNRDKRVLFDANLTGVTRSELKYRDRLVIDSKEHKIVLNFWRERGMYDIRVDGGRRIGKFPTDYVFFVVDDKLIYNRSDYDTIEIQHQEMRDRLMGKTEPTPIRTT